MTSRGGFAMGAGVAVLAGALAFVALRAAPVDDGQAGRLSSTGNERVLLAGTIALSDIAAQKVSGTVTVFVVARDRTAGKGHPLLAKRLDVSSFPTPFSLGSADSMIGQPPSDRVSLEAWIDTDHDAMTRETNTPSARIDSVAIGTKNIVLMLR